MALEYSLVELDLIRVVVRAGKCSKAGGGQRNNGCKWQCMQERDHVWPPDSRLGKEGKISRDGEQWEGDRVNKLVISVRWKDCAAVSLPPSLGLTDALMPSQGQCSNQPLLYLLLLACVSVESFPAAFKYDVYSLILLKRPSFAPIFCATPLCHVFAFLWGRTPTKNPLFFLSPLPLLPPLPIRLSSLPPHPNHHHHGRQWCLLS